MSGRIISLKPEDIHGESIKCKNVFPMSLFQQKINSLFYSRDDSPLSHFGTLGGGEPLLPRAKAKSIQLSQSDIKTIHEVGPGNFNFARNILDSLNKAGKKINYVGHDFSDASYAHEKDSLTKQYGDSFQFNKASLSEFPSKVKDDPLNMIMVEVLDDTMTEFFARNNDSEYMLWMQPMMKKDFSFFSKAEMGRYKARNGDFSLETQRLHGTLDMKNVYSASEIIRIIDDCKWNYLDSIHPDFLKALEYPTREFQKICIDELINTHWRNSSGEFKEYASNVLGYFRSQLKQAPESKTLHIPIAGINLFWRLKDRKNLNIDIFDYGYSNVNSNFADFSLYAGQITSPVNFELLKYSADVLGFNTTLETNSNYIKRMLGFDTVQINYVKGGFRKENFPKKDIPKLLLDIFGEKVKELTPEIEPTEKTIFGCRVQRGFAEDVLEYLKERNFLKPGFELFEGSYHLEIQRG